MSETVLCVGSEGHLGSPEPDVKLEIVDDGGGLVDDELAKADEPRCVGEDTGGGERSHPWVASASASPAGSPPCLDGEEQPSGAL